ncbi:MAG TPA: SCO family protein [Gemmataceae bacterium]|nr:SCO family protein [Gemmataceae bacterium]
MQRAVMAGLLLAALAALGFAGFSALRHNAPPPMDLGPIDDFSLTERSGRTITNADLAGKVWIASFVFTRCTGGCPQVTGNVARIQDAFRNEPDVRLVTFTVDPERDDPDELKKYADHFGADPERWLFLTGSEEQLYRLIEKGFKVPVRRNGGEDVKPGQEVMHGFRLVLVDKRGHHRGYFEGRQVDDGGQPVDELPKLRQAVAALLRETP